MNRVLINLAKALPIFLCCIHLNAQTTWTTKSNLPGTARSGAVSFVSGNYAYVGLGYTGSTITKDFWRYYPSTDTWSTSADFGGVARQNAVTFVVNDTAYVGTGDSGSPNYTKYKDFWKYNPSLNKWIRIADFGGTARTGAVAFSIGNKGYVATGTDDTGELKDVWEYDPTTNTWTRKNDFGSDERKNAVAFTINGKGYICSGWSVTPYTNILSDVQEYNPVTDVWTEKIFADGSLQKKQWAGCFVLNSKAFLISGNNDNTVVVYNPATNALSAETHFGPFGETQRNNPVAFALNGKGYAGLGYVMVSVSNLVYQKDLWIFNATLPPNNPSNLTGISSDNEHVQLTWSDNSTDETYFIIESSKGNNAQFAKIDSVYSNVHSYSVKGLSDSTQYFFRVKAKNNAGYSGYSNEAPATTFAWHVPNAPTNLKVNVDVNNSFNLSWTDNALNDSITFIEISEGDTLHFQSLISTTNSPSCTVSTSLVKDSTTFFFRIRGKNRAGYSPYSNIASCLTHAQGPKTLQAVAISPKEIDILWVDYSYVESGFIIERSENDSLHFQKIDSIGPNTSYNSNLTYKDNKVTEGSIYYYRVSEVIKNKIFYCKNISKASPIEVGSWLRLKDYPGIRAEDGVSFYYNNTVFMGLGGYEGNQFWAFDPTTRAWTKKADLGGKTWSYASTFLINNKGYASMGYFDGKDRNQVWEYDFTNNQWTQKSNAPIPDRQSQVYFSLGNKGYILGGYKYSVFTETKDFWEYDGVNDTWTQLSDFPGGICSNIPVFIYNEKAYLLYKKTELWEFSLPAKTWTKVRTLKQPMEGFRGFSLDEKFISFGYNYDLNVTTLWEYDFLKDTLVKKTYFPGFATREMDYAQGGKQIYVGCGAGNGYTNEFWVYNPSAPANPTKLTAFPVTQKNVLLNWNDNSNWETKYYIERSEGYSGNFVVVDSVNASTTSYSDTTVLKNKSYYYKVRAKNDAGYSDYSNSVFAMTQVPSKPGIYFINTKMDANWIRLYINSYSTSGIVGYIVERSGDGAKSFAVIDTFSADKYSFLDSSLVVGKEYTYRFKAYNTLGNSEYSNAMKVIPGSFYHGSLTNAKIKEAIYFDPYGYDADYSHCYTGVQKLYPEKDGSKLTINFNEFSLYQNDTLTVYNGSDTNSPVLGKYTSTNKPNSLICAKNNEGSLTVRFVAPCGSYAYGYYGWKAIVKCTDVFPPSGLQVKPMSSKRNSLNWIANSDDETKFRIERSVADSIHFSAIDSVAANIISYNDTSVIVGTKYYYRIVAINDNGQSEYSNMVSAKISGVGINAVSEDLELTIFPNPATTYVNIRIYSFISEELTITISNVLGQPVQKLIKNIDSGNSEILIEMENASDGLYYVQLKTRTGTVTKTLVIHK